MLSPAEILGPDGPFARSIPGFATRHPQQEMAEAVARTIDEHGCLVAEAGTGTGKTFAYLVPALLSGKKVLISTGTKALQDQLFNKDLPMVRDALAVPVEVALLKGRANYLCHYRLQRTWEEGRLVHRGEASQLQRIKQWSLGTRSGDIAELSDLPEDLRLWPLVTSTADNCLGGECPNLPECFLAGARRAAQEAEVVVVNHHLLFSDMSLRDEGFVELLPAADAIILDEAHQLPETASAFFGESLSSNQLLELSRDVVLEDVREGGEDKRLREAAEALEKAVRDWRLAFGADPRRGPWREVAAHVPVSDGAIEVGKHLKRLGELLEPQAARGKGMESCLRRAKELVVDLKRLTGEAPADFIHWFETFTRAVTVNFTPLDVAELFRQQLDTRPIAWVFTSATLAVGQDFGHFTHRLGLDDCEAHRWESPFDFARQSLLYVPQPMPEPAAPGYTAAVVEEAIRVLEASRGRAFLLFTSHRALQEAAGLLEGRIDYPMLVQGSAPRNHLLEEFRRLGNAVLLGTGSFWEGVDVRGEALSCVLIDKLPFASPGDPIMQARIEAMRERGQNPFMDYQLPQAVITLKQGVGRLIRDVADRGVLVLCDPRLGSKGYGRTFIESLPPMSKTLRFDVVQRFFANEGATD